MKGGKRKGAGRPAMEKGEKKKGVFIALPPWLIEWMDNQPESRALLIEKSIKKVYQVENPKTEKEELEGLRENLKRAILKRRLAKGKQAITDQGQEKDPRQRELPMSG